MHQHSVESQMPQLITQSIPHQTQPQVHSQASSTINPMSYSMSMSLPQQQLPQGLLIQNQLHNISIKPVPLLTMSHNMAQPSHYQTVNELESDSILMGANPSSLHSIQMPPGQSQQTVKFNQSSFSFKDK